MFLYINGRRVWVELQAADSGGNDGGGNDSALQRLLDRYKGDAMALAEKLFSENFTYREKQRQLEQQVTELSGKVPTAESVVLTGADATAWATYKALGKPEDIKQGLDERTKLQGDLATKDRNELIRGVAEVAGYKPSVLAKLDSTAKAEGKALGFELRDVTVDGKAAKVAYVKDGDNASPLTDYATTNWADFIPSLTAAQGNQQQQQNQGTRHVTQHAGSGTQGGQDIVSKFLSEQQASQAAVKNPLLKG